jgi:hypothetical protein
VYEGDRKRTTEEDEMSVQTGVVQVQPEVVAGAERRRFTAEYKRRILREAAHAPSLASLGRSSGARGCTPRI